MTEYKNTIVNFENNTPVTLVLDVDPQKTKEKKKISKNGKEYSMWTYFAAGKKIFFAYRDLHDQLKAYHRGDVVTITYIIPQGDKYGIYKVEPGNKSDTTNDTLQMVSMNQNQLMEINKKLDAILSLLQGGDGSMGF